MNEYQRMTPTELTKLIESFKYPKALRANKEVGLLVSAVAGWLWISKNSVGTNAQKRFYQNLPDWFLDLHEMREDEDVRRYERVERPEGWYSRQTCKIKEKY